MVSARALVLILIFVVCGTLASPLAAQSLRERLQESSAEELAAEAREFGDARRGAVLFYGPSLGCNQCHTVTRTNTRDLGPSLISPQFSAPEIPPAGDAADRFLIESLLKPAAHVATEYQALQVLTADGQVITGLKLDSTNPKQLRLRELTQRQEIVIAREMIEVEQPSSQSVMPEDVVNALASRSEFLDLVSYLLAIRVGGVERARELEPTAAQLAIKLPDYEANVDHYGFIEEWDDASLRRGEEIYNSLCVNCHGTKQAPGSLATALRFGEGAFKFGSDPYAMYQTLTRGAGLMAPQHWMVPQQKYDVIHYLREKFLASENRSQYFEINDSYLARLPAGADRGPPPRKIEPWSQADYGPRLIGTYEIGTAAGQPTGENIAQKGIAIQLDRHPGGIAQGRAWAVFDHDTLRVAGVWTGQGFIDWHGIHFDGRHNAHPRTVGVPLFVSPQGPGWADPRSGSLADDERVVGRDGRRYGPLPKSWGKFVGIEQAGMESVLHYTIGETDVQERLAWKSFEPTTGADIGGVFGRHLRLGPRSVPLELVVATLDDPALQWQIVSGTARAARRTAASESLRHRRTRPSENRPALGPEATQLRTESAPLWAGFASEGKDLTWKAVDRVLLLTIPAGSDALECSAWVSRSHELSDAQQAEAEAWANTSRQSSVDSQALFSEEIETEVRRGASNHAFAVDVLNVPQANPWRARLRLSGLDFFSDDDRLAVCTWDGDVWIVSGLSQIDLATDQPVKLRWRRVAFGLFQPLGLKVIEDEIYLTCRDQLVHLQDTTGDGFVDFYRCVNNDHQVTEHFHEFAMGLQTDATGNFYYAKSARHALPAVVPHHGTLLRVSPDGSETEIIARGFRAANGVCLNPDGSFIVSDQEGHWIPKNRINWVTEGGFYGNMYGYHDVMDNSDSAMEQPICWITNSFDRSPAELLWVDSPAWGPLQGSLLSFSYGYGRIFLLAFEQSTAGKQGGMSALPLPDFPTGLIRGRFSPHDGQLYTCGLSAWATNQTLEDGGLYRVRYTGRAAVVPLKFQAQGDRLRIEFSDSLGRSTSEDANNYSVQAWDLRRTKNYGSEHHNQRKLHITQVTISEDRTALELVIPDLSPTWGMEVRLSVFDDQDQAVERVFHGTIHHLDP